MKAAKLNFILIKETYGIWLPVNISTTVNLLRTVKSMLDLASIIYAPSVVILLMFW